MEKRGIDISHHQGDINFDKLKGNIDFAMVRTSYGSFYEDKKYKKNIKELERIGVPYGLYHFSYATTIDSAKKEAEGFINIIKNYNPTYPVVIDIEKSDRTKNVEKDILVDITKTICQMIEDSGYYVMIYANLDYLNNKLNDTSLDKYDKWLAQWNNKPTYSKSFGIWQYSSKGNVPGINGNVDLNVAYKDYPSIIKTKKLSKSNDLKDNNFNNTSITSKVVNYVVKKNDTLIKIAKKYNTDYKKIASYNNIVNANKIFAGQVIKIPNTLLEDMSPSTYVVKKGDTLVDIAKKYGISWKELYTKNKDIIGKNPDIIKPGMIFDIN